jgi:hypothetical protein
MRNGNGRSGDVTCSSVAAVETLVHSKPMVAFSRKSATATLQCSSSVLCCFVFLYCQLSVDLNLNILTLLNVVNVVLSGVLNFPVLVVHFPLFYLLIAQRLNMFTK